MGSFARIHLDYLQKLQKKIWRIVTFSTFHSHTEPLMYELKLLKIGKNSWIFFAVGIFMIKYINIDLPGAFNSMFPCQQRIDVYNTRGANQLHLEQFPTNIYYTYINNIFLSFIDVNCIYIYKACFKNILLPRQQFGGREHNILYVMTKNITVSWYVNIIIPRGLSKYNRNLIEHKYDLIVHLLI